MSEERGISRRDLLRGRVGRAGAPAPAGADERAGGGPGAPGRGAQVAHRPPGAVDEVAFLAGCTRCGDCIEACPVDAIRIAPAPYGPAAGTPVIEPMEAPCVMCDDLPCITSCEPNVLTRDAPVAMGLASIRRSYCIAWEGTLCTVCSERCPVEGAIRVERGRPTVVDDRCTGCGVCQHVCPAPYNAVLVLPRAGAALADAPEPDSPPPAGDVDWRAAYFGGRSLRPPGEE
jgi:ferredoxin-type protein NapG